MILAYFYLAEIFWSKPSFVGVEDGLGNGGPKLGQLLSTLFVLLEKTNYIRP